MSLPTKSTQVVFEHNPNGDIVPDTGKPDSTFAVKEAKLDTDLKKGDLLLKTLYLSNDPTQRNWLRKKGDDGRNYSKSIYEGEVMEAYGLAKVIKSNAEGYKEGDIISSRIQWADYSVLPANEVFNKVDTSANLPLSYFLSVLGMTSLTAFLGLTEAGQLRKYLSDKSGKGPVVCVSAASGAVGSTVVQISKHVLGASKVIGLSGSDEKAKWVEKLGADLCVNYKNSNYQDQILKFLDGDYIDVYFDNVGGEILSFVLAHMANFGRIVACGAISGYNDPKAARVDNWFHIIAQCLTVEGFLVGQYKEKFPEAIDILTKAIKEKKVDVDDSIHVETLSGDSEKQKFAKVPQIWNQLFTGEKPKGKLLIKVADA
ncbi:hypothetical protein KGF57_003383 [Candida theae]|uniref:Enoyl reductase (ER) domain-containing protein n=1 Tax=Candida theae TaxID=1198502 RepID=A0AAD5BD78_9ASCO|nr:uncharacterized protein KGF57_003383 [Candida theae]KAI5957074.1 hypothetical protein KGF57_003383 [Candida theae]